tara:strand:- start:281 stop:559 length:279 start_codon:yes stop_codon:yes gene_type:complete
MTTTLKKRRRWAEVWQTLKELKRASLIPSNSENPEVVRRFMRTARKGVQKEKYEDDAFKVRYPFAKLTSTIEGNKLTFVLDLGSSDINAEDF